MTRRFRRAEVVAHAASMTEWLLTLAVVVVIDATLTYSVSGIPAPSAVFTELINPYA